LKKNSHSFTIEPLSDPLHLLGQPVMQTLTESDRNRKDPFVANDIEHLTGTVYQDRATVAALKVRLDSRAEARVHTIINIVR
jgi:hypothetical protein